MYSLSWKRYSLVAMASFSKRKEERTVKEPSPLWDFHNAIELSRICHHGRSCRWTGGTRCCPRGSGGLRPSCCQPPWGGGAGNKRLAASCPEPEESEDCPARGVQHQTRGAMGYVARERSMTSGVIANELHLRATPVSSPMEQFQKDKRRSDDNARRERTRPGF